MCSLYFPYKVHIQFFHNKTFTKPIYNFPIKKSCFCLTKSIYNLPIIKHLQKPYTISPWKRLVIWRPSCALRFAKVHMSNIIMNQASMKTWHTSCWEEEQGMCTSLQKKDFQAYIHTTIFVIFIVWDIYHYATSKRL